MTDVASKTARCRQDIGQGLRSLSFLLSSALPGAVCTTVQDSTVEYMGRRRAKDGQYRFSRFCRMDK